MENHEISGLKTSLLEPKFSYYLNQKLKNLRLIKFN